MSTQKSISGIIGKGSIRHNNREFYAANVNQDRTKDNIVLCKQDIHKAYHELFDKPLSEYNDKQKRKDRCIPDYYEHIRLSKQEKLFYEVIFQIGDMKDTAVGTEDGEQAAKILQEFYEKLQANNPHIHIFNAVIHMDEATPHLHIDFIPVATESKRGLSTRNSLSKALEQQGFKSEGKLNTCAKLWIDSEKERLAECMTEHGLERENKGIKRSNLSVEEYKLQKRMEEVAEIEEQIATKNQELAGIDDKINTSQEELDKLVDKKKKVKALDKIQPEKVLFSDKVKISNEDYDSLMENSKRYITHKSKENFLSAKVKLLESENEDLKETISEQNNELSELKSLRGKLKISSLEQEIKRLQKLVDKLFEFIDKFKLRDMWENFIQKSKKRDRDMER
ncbi:MAG: plasmid recombination enzyme [Clostridia bacterium]|nr:plasmid recombination enzyme [Clostridia bacterium]